MLYISPGRRNNRRGTRTVGHLRDFGPNDMGFDFDDKNGFFGWSNMGSGNGLSTSVAQASSDVKSSHGGRTASSSSSSATPTNSSSGSGSGSSSGSSSGPGRGSSSGSSSGRGSGSSSGSSSGNGSWDDKALQYHNQVRAKHQAPALQWDDSLAQYASDYLSSNNCEFKHSDGPHGENIAIGYKGIGALEAWYNEYKDYSFDNPGSQKGTGHFTQMVWKATTKLGCAKKACSDGEYVVCEYGPPGNVVSGDEYSKNVLPPK